MTASLRSVCADILTQRAFDLMVDEEPREDPPAVEAMLNGARLLDHVDAREAVELVDECADKRDGLQADVDELEKVKMKLDDANNKLKLKNKKLIEEIAALKSELAEQKL